MQNVRDNVDINVARVGCLVTYSTSDIAHHSNILLVHAVDFRKIYAYFVSWESQYYKLEPFDVFFLSENLGFTLNRGGVPEHLTSDRELFVACEFFVDDVICA